MVHAERKPGLHFRNNDSCAQEIPSSRGPTVATPLGSSTFVRIEVETSSGAIEFGSKSEGAGMVPWQVEVEDRSYVVPDDTPARALKNLEELLPQLQISVRDERPRLSLPEMSSAW